MVIVSGNVAQHERPVWIHKADFILHVDLARWGMSGRTEQLWARKLGDSRFELCCIPFFAYGMRLGDVVQTVEVDGRAFMVDKVVQPSGRLNLRVVVPDRQDREVLHAPILQAITDAGCASEVFKAGYFAVDVPTAEAEESLLRALAGWTSAGRLTVEKV